MADRALSVIIALALVGHLPGHRAAPGVSDLIHNWIRAVLRRFAIGIAAFVALPR